jgi:hypothetical protein
MGAVRRGCTECTDRFDSGAERSTCILTSDTESIRASRMAGTQPPPDPERHRGAEGACTRPVSRVLSSVAARTVIPLGVRSPAPSSSLPAASRSRWASSRRLFGLAPAGVYPAVRVTTNTVGSYPTFSPLPVLAYGRLFSVALSVVVVHTWTPRPGVTWQPAHGARTFLGVAWRRRSRPSGRVHTPW